MWMMTWQALSVRPCLCVGDGVVQRAQHVALHAREARGGKRRGTRHARTGRKRSKHQADGIHLNNRGFKTCGRIFWDILITF